MLLLAARVAHAQSSADDDDARRLFAEARADMDRSDWASAEAKLRASYEKLQGKGVAFNLAVCREHLGKLLGARELFRHVVLAERAAGDEARARIAETRANEVSARIPRLRVTVPESLHAIVHVDEHVTTEEAEVDPGAHEVDVSAAGYVAWHDRVQLGESEHREIVVPALSPIIIAPPPIQTPVVFVPPPRAHTLRTTGWITGGAGVVALATGASFALAAGALYAQSSVTCNATTNACTSQAGVDDRNQSLSFGNASTAFVIAGASLVVLGVVLWALDARAPRTRAAVAIAW
jgi:hypothetical protein